jgi:hypothetical protein
MREREPVSSMTKEANSKMVNSLGLPQIDGTDQLIWCVHEAHQTINQQTLAEVGAEKSGASSDQHTRFEVQPQSPRGIGLIQLSPGHLNKSADLST